MFEMKFSTENGIFQEDEFLEAARILSTVYEQVSRGDEEGKIFDLNGNSIGSWSLEFD